jgi:ABC-type uncharacterized transport system YnjBCD substrate-binding protein
MNKLTIKQGIDSSSNIITVKEKRKTFLFTYWSTVETIFCFNQFVDYHLEICKLKYKINGSVTKLDIVDIEYNLAF